jgi:hypothetical protein
MKIIIIIIKIKYKIKIFDNKILISNNDEK